MEHFKLTITEDGMTIDEGRMCIPQFADIACAVITSAVQSSPTELTPAQRKDLFDILNLSFSRCLELTFPEFELHPELTEEVMHEIIDRENQLITERAAEADNTVTVN